MTDIDELVAVGKIIDTHGIKGSLKVYSYSGNIQSLKAVSTVFLKRKDGSLGEYVIKTVSAHAGGFILGLNDFSSINQVLDLVGSELCLIRKQLPALDDDEYYWSDLIGLTVFTNEGTKLGTLTYIFETGSNDIYVVRNNTNEYLIPAIAEVITMVDIHSGKMIITPLEGLLDL